MSLYAPSSVGVDQFPAVDLAGLTTYSFNSGNGYDPIKHYAWRIAIEDVTPSAARDIWFRFSGNVGASYASILQYQKIPDSSGQFLSAANTVFSLTVSNVNAAGTGVSGFLDVMPGTSPGNARIYGTFFYQDNGSALTRSTVEGLFLSAGVVTSFDFLLSGAGTFTKGKLYIQASRRV